METLCTNKSRFQDLQTEWKHWEAPWDHSMDIFKFFYKEAKHTSEFVFGHC